MQSQLKSRDLACVVFALLAACSGAQKTPDSGSGGSGPNPIPPIFVPGDCNLEQPAFCETFEKEFAGGRGGPLDEKVWSVARWGLPSTGGFRLFARHAATSAGQFTNTPSFCNGPFSDILPYDDLRFCDGTDGAGFGSKQLNEVFEDDGSFAFTSLRIRQPFDFANRSGTIVFDVDAKRNIQFDGHGWWVELWLSADPTPMPYHGAPTVASYARRAIGFQIAPLTVDCFHQETPVCNQVGRIVVHRDYKVVRDTAIEPNTGFNTLDTKLNRFKFVISANRVEIFASNYDAAGKMIQVAVADNLGLDWTRGYVHLQHAQYNSPKVNASGSQTYRWDNVAFDGPTYPTPRGYDVPDNQEQIGSTTERVLRYGYDLVPQGLPPTPVNVKVQGIDLTRATNATFNFNVFTVGNRSLKYRFNTSAWHTFVTPAELGGDLLLRTFSLPAPLEELVAGENSIGVMVDSPINGNGAEAVGNMDLTIEATP